MLVEHFARAFRIDNGGGPEKFSKRVLEAMAGYNWPGNVRELRNAVHRAAVLASGDVIRLGDLHPMFTEAAAGRRADDALPVARPATFAAAPDDDPSLDACIAAHIRRVLIAAGGNKSRAAELLGIPRTSLYHKLRKYRIEAEVEQDDDGSTR